MQLNDCTHVLIEFFIILLNQLFLILAILVVIFFVYNFFFHLCQHSSHFFIFYQYLLFLVDVLTSRECCGHQNINKSISSKFYSKQQMHKRYLGHLSSVYCVAFDRTGKYIFTVSINFF